VTEQAQSRNGNRTLWWILGGLAAIVVLGLCSVAFLASLFFIRASDTSPVAVSQDVRREPLVVVTPVSVPTPVAISAGEMDYETAVLTSIYARVNPSVVNVETLTEAQNLPLLPFGQENAPEGFNLNPDDLVPEGQGSGFVWDQEGYIVTNHHVVRGADRVQVTFYDGTASVAEVIGEDPYSDLAVLKVDPEGYNLVPVTIGDMDSVQVGMRVAAIGNPFGFEGTLTSGIVSAIGRSIPSDTEFNIPESIQTDAAINPGNSGGPLLNESGEVIGVNAQIRSTERANSGVGFAIPISIVSRVIPGLIAEGSYEHSYIGVRGMTFNPICSEDLGLPKSLRGAYVTEVIAGTPAARGGLRGGTDESGSRLLGTCPATAGGDVITAIEGNPVTRFDDLLVYLERYTSPGDTITLTVLRGGEQAQLQVTLGARVAPR
jgi:serine protease Do